MIIDDSTENLFTKEDSEQDLKSNSVILDDNFKINLIKSSIDNLQENFEIKNNLNKSQDNIPEHDTSLGVRYSSSSIKKKNLNDNTINRKKKSIYYSVAENKVKLNVLGSEGKNIYEKMTNYVDKYQKQFNENDNSLIISNKKNIPKKYSVDSQKQTNQEKTLINDKSKSQI